MRPKAWTTCRTGFACKIGVANVAGDEQSALTRGLDQAQRLCGIFMLVQIRDGDVGAFLGEADCHGTADP